MFWLFLTGCTIHTCFFICICFNIFKIFHSCLAESNWYDIHLWRSLQKASQVRSYCSGWSSFTRNCKWKPYWCSWMQFLILLLDATLISTTSIVASASYAGLIIKPWGILISKLLSYSPGESHSHCMSLCFLFEKWRFKGMAHWRCCCQGYVDPVIAP